MDRKELINWNNSKYYIDYQTTIRRIVDRMYGVNVDRELVIPEYQRDYVWKETNAPRLLLSLYKGFPIGNIVIWDGKDDNSHTFSLIDGLQRHITILKLYEKEFNYVSFELYEHWLEQKKLELLPWIEETIREQEAFRHFKSAMHHKNKGYRASSYEDAKKFIKKTDAKPFTKEIKERMFEFIKEFHIWHTTTFLNINVPHYILDDMTSKEVVNVFELINITGVTLTRFEVASANWSRYKVHLNEEIEYINKFNAAREEKYKDSFEDSRKVGNHLINYDNKSIIPSNFLYAIFYEIFKDDNELKNTFVDSKYTIVKKSIEPLCELTMHVLKRHFKECEDIDYDNDFDNLGYYLNKVIKKKKDVEKLTKEIKNSFTKVKNSIKYIRTIKVNGAEKSPAYPVWLITAFAIHVVEGSSKDNFNDWFAKELLFEKRLSSATGKKAKEIIANLEFEDKLEFDLSNAVKELADKSEFNLLKYSDRSKAIVLSMIQDKQRDNSSYQTIDHFLPQGILSEYVEEVHSIWNLQYKDGVDNIDKSNELTREQYKHDEFNEFYSDIQKEQMSDSIDRLIAELSLEEVNKDEVNELYNEIISIRREVILTNSDLFKSSSEEQDN